MNLGLKHGSLIKLGVVCKILCDFTVKCDAIKERVVHLLKDNFNHFKM